MKHKFWLGLLTSATLVTSAFGLAACGGGGTGGGTGGGGDNDPPSPPPHTHTFASTWTSDEEFHWHAATCTDTNEQKDRAAHDYENGICSTCKHAHENHNYENGECTVCGLPQPATDGLAYEPADGGYTVIGIGEAEGTEIAIPATHEGEAVVAIGDKAFLGEEIESIIIPASVKSIGQYAFQKSSLQTVTLAEGLETLGYCSFSKCNSLTEFTVPASVETWGTYVFWACENLRKVTFADGLKQVGESAFYQCPALETVAFGGGNIQIGEKAFMECTALARVETPSIADWCSVSLKNRAYRGTTPFEYGATLYAGGKPVVGTLTIPEGVTKIADYAFWFYQKVDRLVLADSVEEIGEESFGQMNIYHLTIGTGLKTIVTGGYHDAGGSFAGFTGYKTWAGIIEINNRSDFVFENYDIGVVEVSSDEECGRFEEQGDFRWYINEKLDRVILCAYTGEGVFTELPASPPYGETYEIGRYFALFSGYGRGSNYFNYEGAKTSFTNIERFEKLIIPDCVTKVGENAFSWEYLTPHFTTIVIGSKVKEIGANAFGSGISKITNLFYHGEEAQWSEVVCADEAFGSFKYPSQAYFYSQAQQEGSYWHYDGSGEPVKW